MMAAEFLLVPRAKFEQMENDLQPMNYKDNSDTALGQDENDNTMLTMMAESNYNNNNSINNKNNSNNINNSIDSQTSTKEIEHKEDPLVPAPAENIHNDGQVNQDEDQARNNNAGGKNEEFDYSYDDVVKSFTEEELKYVHPIIDKMNENPKVMTWDKNTGELLLLGVAAESGSNIIELLKDSLTGNIHPRGKMEFLRGFDMLALASKYLKNRKYKGLLKTIKSTPHFHTHSGEIKKKKKSKEQEREGVSRITTEPKKEPKRLNKVKKIKGWIIWE